MALAATHLAPLDPASAIFECLNTIDTQGGDPVGPYRGHCDLLTVEIWQYNTDDPTTDLNTRKVHTRDLAHWVDKASPVRGGDGPIAGLRLLMGDAIISDEDMPALDERQEMRGSVRHLTNSFGVPSILCAANDHNARFWHPPVSAKAGYEGREQYYANLCDVAVAWSCDPRTHITLGILLFLNPYPKQGRDRLLANLERLRDMVQQPAMLPFAIADTATFMRSNDLRRHGDHISTVDSSLEEFYKKDIRAAVDLRGFSRGTTFRAAQIAMSQRGLHASLALAQYFSEMEVKPSTSASQQKQQTLLVEGNALQSGLRCVEHTIQLLVLNAETYQARMSNQLTLILSLFAQQDQGIGIEIARASQSVAVESKRDSSSMKTLAVVTMFFLPGTFVASFFAMPLFNWQSQHGQVIDRRLWIYFVVTIPLTTITCSVWWAWFTMKTRREQREDKEKNETSGHGGTPHGFDIEHGGSVHTVHAARKRGLRDTIGKY